MGGTQLDLPTIINLSVIAVPIIIPLILCDGNNIYKILFWMLLLEIISLMVYGTYIISKVGYEIANGIYVKKGEADGEINIDVNRFIGFKPIVHINDLNNRVQYIGPTESTGNAAFATYNKEEDVKGMEDFDNNAVINKNNNNNKNDVSENVNI